MIAVNVRKGDHVENVRDPRDPSVTRGVTGVVTHRTTELGGDISLFILEGTQTTIVRVDRLASVTVVELAEGVKL